jgi:hypothetical protein
MLQPLAICACAILFLVPSLSFAQENRVLTDKSRIPLEANDVKDFVPPGWVIEEQVSGNLNGDSSPDLALKLVQEQRAGGADEDNEGQRALVILFAGRDGKWQRVAIAEKLLQCTSCGGAFYGVVKAPANVKIEKGVLIVNQDHGSRNVVEQTFRFRYEPRMKKFILIGLDVNDNDRASGEVVEESTNFITGRKITKRSQYNERLDKHVLKSTSRSPVARKSITIEEMDSESY